MTVTETALVTTADSRGRRTPPIPGRRRRYTADQVTLPRVILRTAAGFLVLAIFVLPYLIMFFGSVKTKAQIRSVDPTYLPVEWHWENYLTMWSTPETPLPYNLVSTIVISVFATLLVLLVSLPAAYYTARFRFPGRMVFLFLVIVTQIGDDRGVEIGRQLGLLHHRPIHLGDFEQELDLSVRDDVEVRAARPLAREEHQERRRQPGRHRDDRLQRPGRERPADPGADPVRDHHDAECGRRADQDLSDQQPPHRRSPPHQPRIQRPPRRRES